MLFTRSMKPSALFTLFLVALCLPAAASAQTCDPSPGAPAVRGIRRFASPTLQSLRRTIRSPLAAAKRSAPGMRRWPEGMEGSTYDVRAYRLGARSCGEELEAMVTDVLRPSPDDFVWYVEARPLRYVEARKIDAVIDADRRSGRREERAVRRLAETIESFVAAHPGLRVFIVNGGWADAVGARDAGVAVVDPDTREAIWIFGASSWSA
jgi:hypothetical protein